jgi:hypothetical protein
MRITAPDRYLFFLEISHATIEFSPKSIFAAIHALCVLVVPGVCAQATAKTTATLEFCALLYAVRIQVSTVTGPAIL